MRVFVTILFLAAALVASAFDLQVWEFTFAPGDVNTITLNVSDTSQLGLEIGFTYPSGGAGNLVLTCSNSFDGQRWYADTAHSITVPLTGVTSTNFSTNLTSLGSFQYFQYTVLNSSGNAIPYFDLKASKKNGL